MTACGCLGIRAGLRAGPIRALCGLAQYLSRQQPREENLGSPHGGALVRNTTFPEWRLSSGSHFNSCCRKGSDFRTPRIRATERRFPTAWEISASFLGPVVMSLMANG